MICTSTMNFIVIRHAGHVSKEVAPHAIWACMGGIRAMNFISIYLSIIWIALHLNTVMVRLTTRSTSIVIFLLSRLGNSVKVSKRASAKSHIDTSIEHASIKVDSLSVSLEEVAPLLVNSCLLSLVIRPGSFLPTVSFKESMDMARNLVEIWIGSTAC